MKKTVLTLIVVLSLLSLACNPDTPEARVEACFNDFMQATADADFERAKTFLSTDSLKELPSEKQFAENAATLKLFKVGIHNIKITDDIAVGKLKMTGKIEGSDLEGNFDARFVKESGVWKIDKLGF